MKNKDILSNMAQELIMIENLAALVRNTEFIVVVDLKQVTDSTRRLKLTCPAHGDNYFKRIGDTLMFMCEHSDHIEKRRGLGDPVPGDPSKHLQR